jgi:NAD(P)-dependent dehydrogenase (short-subunit alcohol dehydrogenase family)
VTRRTEHPYRGKLAVVTGGGNGIGLEIARQLVDAGARVVVLERDADALESARVELEAKGGCAGGFEIDVSDAAAVDAAAAEIHAEHGAADLLFNNAGIAHFGDFLETAPEQWQRVLSVNVLGVANGARAFGREMVARGCGHIVNVSSFTAFGGQPYVTAYAASKAAILSLSCSLRLELAPKGVAVTVVCPGLINTRLIARSSRVGRAASDEAGKRSLALYQRRDYRADRAVRAILARLPSQPAILPVAFEAWFSWYATRLLPSSGLIARVFMSRVLDRAEMPAR